MASWEIREGHVLDRLREMPDGSVQCVVTSPPYWGLRDYRLPPTVWGGRPGCVHKWGGDGLCSGSKGTCYGWRGSLGLEPTPDLFLEHLVAVFREVKRVLRKDGTCWLNMGDCYAGSGKGGNKGCLQGRAVSAAQESGIDTRAGVAGLAPKQRLLMPARCALALQEAGWWVRSEVVWAKGVSFCPTYAGSVMPSSVRDRPTDAHEMVYLLTKAPRYFYDAEAVREQGTCPAGTQGGKGSAERKGEAGVNARPEEYATYSGTRNLRTVWAISPTAFREAHFATFPEQLVEPCILAGTSERGACSECGAPWERVVELGEVTGTGGGYTLHKGAGQGRETQTVSRARRTTGWQPTCEHKDAPTVPCVVLDPFSGSGTVGVVATKNRCDYIGIELNPEYAAMSRRRIAKAAPSLFAGI